MKKNAIAILLLTLITFAFFSRLFFPKLSFFYTPEFASSDIWQFNYPLKTLLSQSLKNFQAPLWIKNMGGGFPLFAEGQTGTFNLYNLIAFFLLDPLIAFNLGIVSTFIIAATGMYFLAREKNLSQITCIFCAFTFAFSGFFITQIQHFNLIQTASFLPWLFLLIEKAVKDPRLLPFLLFIIVLSQQILTSFYQMVLISLFIVGLYVLFLFMQKKVRISWILVFVFATTAGFILSAVQILPTYELMKISARARGLTASESLKFAYPVKHLITFLHPFLLGNPKNGTYPHYSQFSGSIFWENTGYIGIISLGAILLTIIIPKLRKKRFIHFLWFLLLFSVFLMIGKQGPLYFLLTIPPFSFFRVSSRFILPLVFSASLLTGFGLEWLGKKLSKKKGQYLFIAILALQIINIFYVWYNYHPTVTKQELLEKPAMHQYTQGGRIYTNNQGTPGFKLYSTPENFAKENFLFHAKNELSPNINMLYGVQTTKAYASLTPLRLAYYNSFLKDVASEKGEVEFFQSTLNLLSFRNTTTIISPNSLTHPYLELAATIKKNPEDIAYYIYKNTAALPRMYFVENAIVKNTLSELATYIQSEEFSPAEEIIIEKPVSLSTDYQPSNEETVTNFTIFEDTDRKLSLTATTNKPSYLVVADTYYPGWEAYVDGKKQELLAANLINRAVTLESGTHEVEFVFTSKTFQRGLHITIIGYLAISGLIVLVLLGAFLRKASHKKLPTLHLQNT